MIPLSLGLRALTAGGFSRGQRAGTLFLGVRAVQTSAFCYKEVEGLPSLWAQQLSADTEADSRKPILPRFTEVYGPRSGVTAAVSAEKPAWAPSTPSPSSPSSPASSASTPSSASSTHSASNASPATSASWLRPGATSPTTRGNDESSSSTWRARTRAPANLADFRETEAPLRYVPGSRWEYHDLQQSLQHGTTPLRPYEGDAWRAGFLLAHANIPVPPYTDRTRADYLTMPITTSTGVVHAWPTFAGVNLDYTAKIFRDDVRQFGHAIMVGKTPYSLGTLSFRRLEALVALRQSAPEFYPHYQHDTGLFTCVEPHCQEVWCGEPGCLRQKVCVLSFDQLFVEAALAIVHYGFRAAPVGYPHFLYHRVMEVEFRLYDARTNMAMWVEPADTHFHGSYLSTTLAIAIPVYGTAADGARKPQ